MIFKIGLFFSLYSKNRQLIPQYKKQVSRRLFEVQCENPEVDMGYILYIGSWYEREIL